jgi:hypothetical protein
MDDERPPRRPLDQGRVRGLARRRREQPDLFDHSITEGAAVGRDDLLHLAADVDLGNSARQDVYRRFGQG